MSPDDRRAVESATPPLNPLLTGGTEYPFVMLERRRRAAFTGWFAPLEAAGGEVEP